MEAVGTDPRDERRGDLAEWLRFLRSESHVLSRKPSRLFQQAVNQPGASRPAMAAEQRWRSERERRPWLRFVNKPRRLDPCLLTLVGHEGRVRTCAFSPNGRRVVSAGGDGTVRLWDADNGQELAVLVRNANGIGACAFSEDGRAALAASELGWCRAWSVESGEEVAVPADRSCLVRYRRVSSNRRRIVEPAAGHSLAIVDVESGAQLASLSGHSAPITAFGFTSGERRIVSASEDGTLRVWAADPQAPWLRAWYRLRAAWAKPEDVSIHTLAGHGRVAGFRESPDGRRIVSASWDGTLKIWDALTGGELATLAGHDGRVVDTDVSPDGRRIVSASSDGTLKIWEAESSAGEPIPAAHHGAIRACDLSNDGRRLATSGADGTVRLWDTETGEAIALLPIGGADPTTAVTACAFSPDGTRIAAGTGSMLGVWDPETGRVETRSPHIGEIAACAFSPDGLRLVSASSGTLRLWDAASVGLRRERSGDAVACAFSTDGRRVVAITADEARRARSALTVWDAETGRGLAALAGHSDRITGWAQGPDGRGIVTASADGTLRIWDAQTGAAVATLVGHAGVVNACAVSPHARWVVSASDDGTLKIWDARSGAVRATLRGHAGPVVDCAVTPDGRWIASVSADRTLRLWDAETGDTPLGFDGGFFEHVLAGADGLLAATDQAGHVVILRVVGLPSGPPWAIVGPLYRFDRGRFEPQPTASCARCGRRFVLAAGILEELLDRSRAVAGGPPNEAGAELPLSACPHCRQSLRIGISTLDPLRAVESAGSGPPSARAPEELATRAGAGPRGAEFATTYVVRKAKPRAPRPRPPARPAVGLALFVLAASVAVGVAAWTGLSMRAVLAARGGGALVGLAAGATLGFVSSVITSVGIRRLLVRLRVLR